MLMVNLRMKMTSTEEETEQTEYKSETGKFEKPKKPNEKKAFWIILFVIIAIAFFLAVSLFPIKPLWIPVQTHPEVPPKGIICDNSGGKLCVPYCELTCVNNDCKLKLCDMGNKE